MLSFLKRRTEPETSVDTLPLPDGGDQQASQLERGACLDTQDKQMPPASQDTDADARRNRQQNIKVSDDCAAAFAALAKALGLSKAALFEDLVAERLEALQRRGVKIEV
jgi:hypothetical protein